MKASVLPELRLPGRKHLDTITSAEAAECGLACLAMVARYHGHDISLNTLRQRFSVSLMGTTLRSLMTMADQLGLSSRALRVDLSSVRNLALPAILHWDMNHFVVVSEVTATHVKIHDPAFGSRSLSFPEVSKHFTGVALELVVSPSFTAIRDRQTLKVSQLWSTITGGKNAVIQIFVLSAALQLVTFAAPFQLQLVIDNAIYHGDTNLLGVIALVFGTMIVLQSGIQYLRDRVVLLTSNALSYQVVGNLVRHLVRLCAGYFEKRHIGDVLSRMRSFEPVRNAIVQGLISAIIDGAISLLAIFVLFFYSAVLASIVLCSVGLYLVAMILIYPTLRERTYDQILASAGEQTKLMENLRAAITIKLMGREAEREAAWRNKYAAVINTTLAVGNISLTTAALQNLFIGIQTVLVVFFAGRMIIAGTGFSIGMLVAFFSFRQTFSDRATSLINQLMQFQLLGVHLDRLGDIVYGETDTAPTAIVPVAVHGGIRMKDVSFRYGEHDPGVLSEVSLDIAPGDFVAIVGASGSGKSTLAKLMLGLYRPQSGEIYLDGQLANEGIWQSWRAHVGVVAQNDRLLSGTVADNIAFFDPDLDIARVHEAAKAARIHDEIMSMPMRYLALIGDMGSSLSGGQKQRVLLARALYRNPKVLFLDEGTANLDATIESSIADLVAGLPITRVVIAHSAALVSRADRVYTMGNGHLRITPRG